MLLPAKFEIPIGQKKRQLPNVNSSRQKYFLLYQFGGFANEGLDFLFFLKIILSSASYLYLVSNKCDMNMLEFKTE